MVAARRARAKGSLRRIGDCQSLTMQADEAIVFIATAALLFAPSLVHRVSCPNSLHTSQLSGRGGQINRAVGL
jgi:hypothetical protein